MQTYSLYSNTVSLEFDERRHVYTINSEIFPSVTSIIKVIDKSGPLMAWAINTTLADVKDQLQPGVAYDELAIARILEAAKGASRRKSSDATLVGTMAHDWISQYIKSKTQNVPEPTRPLNMEANNSIDAFLTWEKQHSIVYVSSERKIVSLRFKYAGTLDIEAEVDGKRCVLDIKTSKAIYPEYFLQTAAYITARKEEENIDYAGSWIIRIDKTDGSIETQFSDQYISDFAVFDSCMTVSDWVQSTKKPYTI